MRDIKAIWYLFLMRIGIKKNYPAGTWMWHVHHETLVEMLTEPLFNRVSYILTDKPSQELPIRLAVLSPVAQTSNLGYLQNANFRSSTRNFNYEDEIEKLHAREHINCPWDKNQRTIFPKTKVSPTGTMISYEVPDGFKIVDPTYW